MPKVSRSTAPAHFGPCFALFTLIALLAGCDRQEGGSPSETVTAVRAWTIESQTVEVERRWLGRLEPLRVHPVQAPDAGRVSALTVRDGDRVAAGDVVVRMESPDLEARRGVLNERLEFLEAELARWQSLAEIGAAGPAEVSEAAMRLLEARDQSRQLQSSLETYLVRAPAAGVVYGVAVNPGANVGDGQVLMNVEDGRAFGIRLAVPALETRYFDDIERLSLVDDRDVQLPIERIVQSSNPHPSFVNVDVYVEGTGGRRSATIAYRSSEAGVIIPWTAVASDGERQWVAVIGEGDPPRIERRTVQIGRAHAAGIEILEGLNPGERVVQYEPRTLPEGRAVAPRDAEQQEGP